MKDWERPRQGGLSGRGDKAILRVEKEMSENVGANGRASGGREKTRNGGERNDEGVGPIMKGRAQ